MDSIDNCPNTIPGRIVDANGCEIEDSDDDDSNTILEGLLSGDGGAVTTTVGIGAILLAILALLQTNAVAAMLPRHSAGSKCYVIIPNSLKRNVMN